MRAQQHLFPIIDELVDHAIDELKKIGEPISCRKGCDHCCHLLVEVSWAEAEELALWVKELPAKSRKSFLARLSQNRKEAKRVFSLKPEGKKFLKPAGADAEIPEWVYEEYFYKSRIPCAFLLDGVCQSYEVRPSPCRLHLVTHDPELCKPTVADDEDYGVPEIVEETKNELGPIISGINKRALWGQMGIMVSAVLKERFDIEVDDFGA
jgi:Fe-S-cluster containining protein